MTPSDDQGSLGVEDHKYENIFREENTHPTRATILFTLCHFHYLDNERSDPMFSGTEDRTTIRERKKTNEVPLLEVMGLLWSTTQQHSRGHLFGCTVP